MHLDLQFYASGVCIATSFSRMCRGFQRWAKKCLPEAWACTQEAVPILPPRIWPRSTISRHFLLIFRRPRFEMILLEELRRAALVLDLCRPSGTWESQVTVAMTGGGDRAFLTHRSGPAFPDISIEDIRRTGATHLHIGELATLIERPEIIDLAREVGLTISLDCGWDDTLKASEISTCLSGVDIFMPNEAEVLHLLSIGVVEPFAPLTVVKKGAKGATAISAGIMHSAPAENVHAVDTTGAGDAFNAGFISAWLDGNHLEKCLHAGNALGAIAITRRGGAQFAATEMSALAMGSEAAE
jgi:sugar/nucleoside kinase (ribokinase family)